MKLSIAGLGICALMLAGCAAGMGSPIPGQLWAEVKAPRLGIGEAADAKEGRAVCKSILGMVALGDCSIEAAKKQGGLSKVEYVDMQTKNILGVYAEYTTVVRGQ